MSHVAFTVLFIQTEDVLVEKEKKNFKVVERFRIKREFAQGSLCIELERDFSIAAASVFIETYFLIGTAWIISRAILIAPEDSVMEYSEKEKPHAYLDDK